MMFYPPQILSPLMVPCLQYIPRRPPILLFFQSKRHTSACCYFYFSSYYSYSSGSDGSTICDSVSSLFVAD